MGGDTAVCSEVGAGIAVGDDGDADGSKIGGAVVTVAANDAVG